MSSEEELDYSEGEINLTSQPAPEPAPMADRQIPHPSEVLRPTFVITLPTSAPKEKEEKDHKEKENEKEKEEKDHKEKESEKEKEEKDHKEKKSEKEKEEKDPKGKEDDTQGKPPAIPRPSMTDVQLQTPHNWRPREYPPDSFGLNAFQWEVAAYSPRAADLRGWMERVQWLHPEQDAAFMADIANTGTTAIVTTYDQWASMVTRRITNWRADRHTWVDIQGDWPTRFKADAEELRKSKSEFSGWEEALTGGAHDLSDIWNIVLNNLDDTEDLLAAQDMANRRPANNEQLQHLSMRYAQAEMNYWASKGCSVRDVLAADTINLVREGNRHAYDRDPPINPLVTKALRERLEQGKQPMPTGKPPRWVWWFYDSGMNLLSPALGTPREVFYACYERTITRAENNRYQCKLWADMPHPNCAEARGIWTERQRERKTERGRRGRGRRGRGRGRRDRGRNRRSRSNDADRDRDKTRRRK